MAAKKELKLAYSRDSKSAVDKYVQLHSKATRIADTTDAAFSEVYTSALDVLKGEDGTIDYSKLDEEEHRTAFHKKMVELYVGKAKKHFKVTGDLDAMDTDRLMSTYIGITSGQLMDFITAHGKEYTLNKHEEIKGEVMKNIRSGLYKAASGHLLDSDTKELLGRVPEHDKVVHADRMTIDDAVNVHELYDNSGEISANALRRIYKAQGKKLPTYVKSKKEVASYTPMARAA